MTMIDSDALSRCGELTAELSEDGVPGRPVVIVVHGTAAFRAPWSPPWVRPIVVLVESDAAPGRAADPALRAFADLTLRVPRRDREPAAGDDATVEVPDPVAAADAFAATAAATPRAALILAQLLRTGAWRDVPTGLFSESVAYSTLLAGPEYAGWRAAHPPRGLPAPEDGPPVRVDRHGADLHITLTRPARRNALGRALRDALLEALEPARRDPSLRIEIDAEGPAFCSGGDLDEFGSAPEPAAAHHVRLATSLGAALHELRGRATVRVHGPCHGAGVELPAFAGRVIATPQTSFTLPELAMGLIPGAGGTTALPRRIGTARTLWLAVSGRPLDAATAWRWGLVDELA